MLELHYDRYGGPDVLRVAEVPERAPGAGQARVRVTAVALNPIDWKIRAGHVRFLPVFRAPPRGVGCDFAGEIVGVGGGATVRHVGERVMGSLMPFGREGALASSIIVPFDRLLPLPPDVDDVTAATLPIAGGTALQALIDDASVMPGQRVLITGAAGGVGHFAVQIAKHLGAQVIAVCSTNNVEFVRSLGADEVIDYVHDDWTARADAFDVVFDAACASTFTQAARVLTERGVYLNTGGSAAAVMQTARSALLGRFTSRRRAILVTLRNRPALWQRLVDLVRTGAVRPHIERLIAIEEVADAQRAMETGHARGKIVVRMA